MARLALLRPFAALTTLALAAGCASTAPTADDVTVELTGDAVAVLHEGELFTAYHHEEVARPFLYPVVGPGGVPVTRSYPIEEREGEEPDHPHHTSLWFAHGSVNGHDFWHGEENRIVNADAIAVSSGSKSVTIYARNRWMAGEEHVLDELRHMAFRFEEGRRVLDFDFWFKPASRPVTFGDTKEGTFALRLHPALRLRGKVAAGKAWNSTGHAGKEVWGKRAKWVAYSGPIEGQTVTVVILDHPANTSHPTWWHARDYGLFAANPFGVHDFEGKPAGTGDVTIAADETLRLRYRVLLLAGEASTPALDAEWTAYAGF